MATFTLYDDADQVVDSNGAGNTGTIGTHVVSSEAGTLPALRLYSPPGFSLTQLPTTIGLFDFTSQALIHSETASWSGAAGSGFVRAPFSSPPAIDAGTDYMIAAFRDDALNAWFCFTGEYTYPATNGPLTAPDDTGHQGWFDGDDTSAIHFPSSQLSNFNWYLDAELEVVTSVPLPAAAEVTSRGFPLTIVVDPYGPILLEDGTEFLLEDGTPLLAEGTVTAVPLPPAAEVTSEGFPLVPPVILRLPAAAEVAVDGTAPRPAQLLGPAEVTSAGHPLTPAVVMPAAAAVTSEGFAPRAAVLMPPAAIVTSRARPLKPPPGSALSTGYPDDRLDAKVEFQLGGRWTDVTPWLTPDGQLSGTVKSGQADGAQQPTPATLPLTLDNGDYRFSPRNAGGPYAGQLRQNTPARMSFASPFGRYLRMEADDAAGTIASVADKSALHVTGSMELRIELQLSDWRAAVFAARWGATGTPAWLWGIRDDDGTVQFSYVDSRGTEIDVFGNEPPPYKPGVMAFRMLFDAATGTVTQYYGDSIDGTWTQLGTPVSASGGAPVALQAGDQPLTVGYSGYGGALGQLHASVYGFRMYSGATVVADAGFSAQSPGIPAWADSAGNAWKLSGGAELSARDYRLHGELSSIVPSAAVSGNVARVAAQMSGRIRRLQQGAAPSLDSAMKRAILGLTGDLVPVDYWTMEDGAKASAFGPAIGPNLLTVTSGTPKPAADSSFEASAALPTFNGAGLEALVSAYTGGTAWTVRFLAKIGSSLPAAGEFANVVRVITSSSTVRQVDVNVDSVGNLQMTGSNPSGGNVFDTGWIGFNAKGQSWWWGVEAIPQPGGQVEYNLVVVAPGAPTGGELPSKPMVTTTLGNVTSLQFNTVAGPDGSGYLTDTSLGHVTLQKTFQSLFDFGVPLNAWRGELSANRVSRICAENSIPCRIIGDPSKSAAMGPQPAGTAWNIFKDCQTADQGILFEPGWAANGVGYRTLASMLAQDAAVTLSFSAGNLPGDLQPADDDLYLANDVTVRMQDGTTYRVTLDDGSGTSVSEPEDGGAGRYQASPTLNLADASQLPDAAARYLAIHSADGARYRQVAADFGIPGAPVADIARLRPGDLAVLADPPPAYQTGDIQQLATGATEAFGPGRKLTWDCIPASPYGTPGALLDTSGGQVLDAGGAQILDTGA